MLLKISLLSIASLITLSATNSSNAMTCNDSHYFSENHPEVSMLNVFGLAYQIYCKNTYDIQIKAYTAALFVQKSTWDKVDTLRRLGNKIRNSCIEECGNRDSACPEKVVKSFAMLMQEDVGEKLNRKTCNAFK